MWQLTILPQTVAWAKGYMKIYFTEIDFPLHQFEWKLLKTNQCQSCLMPMPLSAWGKGSQFSVSMQCQQPVFYYVVGAEKPVKSNCWCMWLINLSMVNYVSMTYTETHKFPWKHFIISWQYIHIAIATLKYRRQRNFVYRWTRSWYWFPFDAVHYSVRGTINRWEVIADCAKLHLAEVHFDFCVQHSSLLFQFCVAMLFILGQKHYIWY